GYRVYIGTSTSGTDIMDGEEVTGTTYIPTTDWEENTTYYVTVVPFNAAGEAAGCAEISFTTTTLLVLPECTTITAPENEATDVGLGAGITWSTVDRADGYRIFIGTTAGGTDILDGEEVTGTAYTTATDWEENTTYYVTVVPYNAAGEAEGCTEISFTTATLLRAPDCTAITSPEDSDTDIGLGAGITWSEADGADGYRIYIGTTAGGIDIVDGEEITGTTYTPTTDWEENTTYYVTVVPFNAAGEAEGCAEIRFTTTTLLRAPECTPITFPENEATDVGLDAGITWPVANGADGYRIYVGTTAGGTDIIDGEEVTGTTHIPTTDWEENTTYYVTVVPFNAAGEAEGCTEISFTTTTLLRAPDCTTVTSPIDGAGSTSLDAGITWTAVEGAEGYRISIGTTPGGTEIADNETVMGTVFHPAFDFAENTPYYLSVVPFNAAGEATGCSQTRFVIIPDENQTGKDVGRTKYGFSPNGDGINDFWEIDGIEQYPDNTVSIYNRWGDRIFEIRQYDNQSRVFKGVANQLTRLGAGILPAGTYFFIIQYRDNQETKKVEGFLVLKR
ncbi:MAG: gliding motility-associated C-terminal domain-containing protein, partial [Parapedobacter sp.]